MNAFKFDTIKEALNPVKFIDQAEKNAQAVLAYVEPKDLSKTLVTLTGDFSTFARAQVEAFNSVASIVSKQAEELSNQFAKLVK